MRKRGFIQNALILTASSLILRTAGTFFGVYLSGKIGAAGMGLFQLIFTAYMLFATFATSGISLAVTRIVSESTAMGVPETGVAAVRRCLLFCVSYGLLAMTALYLLSDFIAARWLLDERAALPLKILSPSLPCLAVASCLRGYFIAVGKVEKSMASDFLENFVYIGLVMLFVDSALPKGLAFSCSVLMGASTSADILSVLFSLHLYRKEKKLYKTISPPKGIGKKVLRISLPIAAGSYVRSGLATIENMLIPRGLTRYEGSSEAALARYGLVKGMVLPVLFFPSVFFSSFCSLLVPEVARAGSVGDGKRIEAVTARALRVTLLFSFITSGFFYAFSFSLGETLYQSREAGLLMRVLSPLVPLLFLDTVVDSLLKGLDQQVNSLKYNTIDTALRVVLIFFLVPKMGVSGYIIVLFAGSLVNVALSLMKLIKVSLVRIRLVKWIFGPILSCAFSVTLISLVWRLPGIREISGFWALIPQILLSLGAYLLMLYASGCAGKEDVRSFKRLLTQNRGEKPFSRLFEKPSITLHNWFL